MARQKYTPEEAREFAAQLTKRAEEQMVALLQSGQWQTYANFLARFHRYSPNNARLILMQCPHAEIIAGFNHWKAHGRTIRKGEKAIHIYAPMSVKTNEAILDPNDPDNLDAATPVRKTIFKLVPVFDVSQTEGEPLPPEPGRGPLDASNRAQGIADYMTLADCLKRDGIAIEMPQRPEHETSRGHWNADKRSICVYYTDNPADAYRVLLHETAHYLAGHAGRADGLSKQEKEITVEIAAYIAAAAQGYDLAPQSIAYLANWSREEPAKLRQYADSTHHLARKLIDYIGATKPAAAAAAA